MHTIEIPAGLETGYFVLSDHALEELSELLRTAFPNQRPWPVADDNTWAAAGRRAVELLTEAGLSPYEPFIFPGTPRLHPDYRYSQDLAKKIPADAVPVAIGSGVINDIVKCAADLAGKRYCCVPTACSVDGYAANGGAMAVNGTKKTVRCPAPYAICADTTVMATAPAPMLSAGYADLLAKLPGGADWLIADAIGDTPIAPDIWKLVQGPLRGWLKDCHDSRNILSGLNATGFSIQMYHDSRPASGAEHLFSHIWEMEGLQLNGEDISHGFKVGIGVLASSLLMEFVQKNSFAAVADQMRPGLTRQERLAEIDELLKRGCYGQEPRETAMRKFMEGKELAERRNLIESKWEEIRARIAKQMPSFEELRKMLKEAGCPIRPAEIGLTSEQFRHGIPAAQLIRVRYTILDLLYETGLLQAAMRNLDQMDQ